MIAIRERDGGVRFAVRVQPRSSRTAVEGTWGDALRVRLTAPPVDDAANDALIGLLAESLGVPRRAVRIVGGSTSRTKTVEVIGVTTDAVRRLASGARDGYSPK